MTPNEQAVLKAVHHYFPNAVEVAYYPALPGEAVSGRRIEVLGDTRRASQAASPESAEQLELT